MRKPIAPTSKTLALTEDDLPSDVERMGHDSKARAPEPSSNPAPASLLERVPDLVACFEGGPSDLSTHPAHLSGFGQG